MESSVGYSQGSGTKIATHQFGTGVEAIHHQRFAVGTGKAQMMQIIAPAVVPLASALQNCKSAGRIVLSALCTTDGVGMKINFFDEKLINMGSSDLIEPIIDLEAAYSAVPTGWALGTTYGPLELLKIAANSHIYMQVAGDPDFVEGVSDASTEPVWPTDGSTIADGTCVWKDLGIITNLKTTPLIVFSNSMGASFFSITLITVAGTITVFGDAV